MALACGFGGDFGTIPFKQGTSMESETLFEMFTDCVAEKKSITDNSLWREVV